MNIGYYGEDTRRFNYYTSTPSGIYCVKGVMGYEYEIWDYDMTDNAWEVGCRPVITISKNMID